MAENLLQNEPRSLYLSVMIILRLVVMLTVTVLITLISSQEPTLMMKSMIMIMMMMTMMITVIMMLMMMTILMMMMMMTLTRMTMTVTMTPPPPGIRLRPADPGRLHGGPGEALRGRQGRSGRLDKHAAGEGSGLVLPAFSFLPCPSCLALSSCPVLSAVS